MLPERPESDYSGRYLVRSRQEVRNTALDEKVGQANWTSECHTERLKSTPISFDERRHDFVISDQGPWHLPLPPRLEIVNLSASLNVVPYR